MRTRRVWALVGAAVVTGVTAVQGVAAATKHEKVVSVGAVISRNGNSFEAAYKLTSSLYGHGAAVQVGKLTGSAFPLHGSDTTTAYYAGGVAVTKDKFTVGVIDAAGIGKVTGTGHCAGGTGIHKHQRCQYKLTGTYNSKTMISHVTAIGTAST
jgi:hypothetical protein